MQKVESNGYIQSFSASDLSIKTEIILEEYSKKRFSLIIVQDNEIKFYFTLKNSRKKAIKYFDELQIKYFGKILTVI